MFIGGGDCGPGGSASSTSRGTWPGSRFEKLQHYLKICHEEGLNWNDSNLLLWVKKKYCTKLWSNINFHSTNNGKQQNINFHNYFLFSKNIEKCKLKAWQFGVNNGLKNYNFIWKYVTKKDLTKIFEIYCYTFINFNGGQINR